jgi:hypothetical protein
MDPPDEVWAARAPLTPPFATPANGSEAASEVYRESGWERVTPSWAAVSRILFVPNSQPFQP